MNITEMNAQEKSVMLAKLCGVTLQVSHTPHGKTDYCYMLGGTPFMEQDDLGSLNWLRESEYIWSNYMPILYDPANMALAWRVLNWALEQAKPTSDEVWALPLGDELFGWLSAFSPNDDGLSVFELPPAEAQAAWLDKILELAIKAGMVKDG